MEPIISAKDNKPMKKNFFSWLVIILLIFPAGLMGESPSPESKKEPSGKAYRPSDFPEIFGVDPVSGLASIADQQFLASEPDTRIASLTNLAKPPLSEGIFPCSACHKDMETDETVREVGPPHDNIKLKHGIAKERWCLDCHNAKDRDFLRLINGTLVPFEESPRLCGQCHGTIYRDWKIGIHGKRVGFWNGPKIYLLCVHCHDQHHPRYPLLTPLPPPVKPEVQKLEPKKGVPAEGLPR